MSLETRLVALAQAIATDIKALFAKPASAIAAQDIANWDNSFSWGDHAAAGYLPATNGTLTTPTLVGCPIEDFYTVSGTTPVLDPANGTLQTWALTGNSTPTGAFVAGESMTLRIDDGTAYTVTWTSLPVVWIGGAAPQLTPTGYTHIQLWKVGTTIYGAHIGNSA